ncbi:zinc ribbon domain-containing protein [Nonomuraea turcica]
MGPVRRHAGVQGQAARRTLVKAGRFFPSSKRCSACHTVVAALPLHVRSWTCSACVTLHDRDVNSAINLQQEGRRLVAAGRKPAPETGGKRGLKTPAETGKTPPSTLRRGRWGTVDETGSHGSAAA